MTTQIAEPQTRKWTKAEYYKAGELGWFNNQRVQLIFGEIIQMPPQGHLHVKAVHIIRKVLEDAFGPDHWVRSQAPIDASDQSQPEPDVGVTEKKMQEYHDHPNSLILAVEVSDATLNIDRRKAALYAASRVPEYWLLNVKKRTLEVYRTPIEDIESESGFSYSQCQVLKDTDSVSPLSLVSRKFKIAEFLE